MNKINCSLCQKLFPEPEDIPDIDSPIICPNCEGEFSWYIRGIVSGLIIAAIIYWGLG